MSLEHQIRFDISHCSLCELGKERRFCTPAFHTESQVMLVLEAPDMKACEDGNPWAHPASVFLSKALGHAHGPGWERFHLTFLLKCYPQVQKKNLSLRARLTHAATCSQHYLDKEIRHLRPQKVIIFGETCARLCFPDLAAHQWPDCVGSSRPMAPYGIPTTILENPLSVSARGGLSSECGHQFVKNLHHCLGGVYNPPDRKVQVSLFDMF